MTVDIAKRFGQNVKRVRLSKKLSQGKLAKKLGVDPSYISQIERGVGNPSLGVVERVAQALEISTTKLIN
jgi:transcriptional regulator with XRE-family HTH domain